MVLKRKKFNPNGVKMAIICEKIAKIALRVEAPTSAPVCDTLLSCTSLLRTPPKFFEPFFYILVEGPPQQNPGCAPSSYNVSYLLKLTLNTSSCIINQSHCG